MRILLVLAGPVMISKQIRKNFVQQDGNFMKPLLRHRNSIFLYVLLLFLWSSFVVESGNNEHKKNSSSDKNSSTSASGSSSLNPSFAAALNYEVNEIAIQQAIKGYRKLSGHGESLKDNMVVIDYSKSGNETRFYVINMSDTTILHSSLVAHGKNTGELYATNFSNKEGSYKSSLGFFKTAETYSGKHGLSLRLDGLEYGINHNARERAIVIHSANYVSQKFIDEHGRLGRSHGCPALPLKNYEEVIHSIKEGCLLYIYADQNQYAYTSEFLADNR